MRAAALLLLFPALAMAQVNTPAETIAETVKANARGSGTPSAAELCAAIQSSCSQITLSGAATALKFVSTATAGNPGVEVVQSARICLNSPTCTRYLSYDGAYNAFSGGVNAGGQIITTGGYSTGTAPTWSVGNTNQTATYRATKNAGANAIQHQFYSDAAMGEDDAVAAFRSGSTTEVARITGIGAFAPEGVPTASLPTCNSTAPSAGGTRGSIIYDTTTNTFVFCNGTAWKTFAEVP